jgi:hypothetical protein
MVSSTCSEYSSVHRQANLYRYSTWRFVLFISWIHISSLVDGRMYLMLIWMHERNTIKLHVQVFLRINTWIFGTCRRQFKSIKHSCQKSAFCWFFLHRNGSDLLRAGRSGDWIPVGARFSAPFQTGCGAHPASYTMWTGSFPGVKWPGRGVDHPPSYSAEVTERVQLYLYSPSWPSWPVLGWTLALPLRKWVFF